MRQGRQEALFPKLASPLVDCLKPHGTVRDFADGEVLYRQGSCGDSFFIVLEGQVKVTQAVAGQEFVVTIHDPGEFTGELSVLTRVENVATGTALGATRALYVPFDQFHRAVSDCPEMMHVILPALAQRRPDALALQNQREKLASLGVLAAGLAHELNNPASAASRAASQLRDALIRQRRAVIDLCQCGLRRDQIEALRRTLVDLAGRRPEELDPLRRSDLETEIGERLEAMEVDEPWEIAAALVDAGLTPDEVAAIAGDLPCASIHAALRWLADSLTVETLVQDIEQSAERIGGLVGAVKSYTYMDQAPVQEVNVCDGIESTLTMLGHKIRRKGLHVRKEFDPAVPRISAFAGELNQVWTNLIDNAIDALPEGGTITLRATPEGDCVRVDVEDDGPGIPKELQDRVFDPFFTTKGVGEGTGLGLDIAYKIVVEHHGGDLSLESQPGRTVFTVRLPAGSNVR